MSNDAPESRAPEFVWLTGTMLALSVFAVFIRFWSRIILKAELWWDDWLALLSLIPVVTVCGLFIHWTNIGFGKHVKDVPKHDIVEGLKFLYAGEIPYAIGITLPKLSVLFLYARIFGFQRRYTVMLWITGVLVVAWVIFHTLSSIWQCTPISKAWNKGIPGTCLNYSQWWLWSSISSVIIDTMILILPLPSLWGLHLHLGRKILILGLFICGYAVIVISIGRTVVNLQQGDKLQKDITWNFYDDATWIVSEGPVSIVSICLPCIFSFAKRGIAEGPGALFRIGSDNSRQRARLPSDSEGAQLHILEHQSSIKTDSSV